MITDAPPRRRIGPAELPIAPLLLAAFPILFLFAENAVQQVTLEPLWLPLGAALAGAAVTLILCIALFRDVRRGGLLASLLVALFFSFGHAWNVARDDHGLTDRMTLAYAWLAIAIVAFLVIWRSGRWATPAMQAVNVAAIVLFGMNLVRVGQFAIGSTPPLAPEAASAVPLSASVLASVERRPDVYYIILDRYANAETLRELYDFDNTPFLDALRERGFAVAEDSWANYFKTALSLTSSLGMDFLDGEALKAASGGGASFKPLHNALRERLAVPATFKSLGYEYVHIANTWEPTGTNVDADRLLRYSEGSEFSSAVVATTAWSLTEPWVPPTEPEDLGEGVGPPELLRTHTLFQLDALADSVERPGPTFVFAHLLLPHSPWRFNADGSIPSADDIASRTRDENYLQHVQFTNMRIIQVLDRLLDVPPGEEPVIIVQADEGEFPIEFARNQVRFDWLNARDDQVQRKFGILNAMRLPGVDPAAVGFHDRITPVNAFRIVFNAYFDAGLPLLPDTTYLSPNYIRMFDFVPYDRPEGSILTRR